MSQDAPATEPFEKQRIDRPDGRYVLVYSFPDGPQERARAIGQQEQETAGEEQGRV